MIATAGHPKLHRKLRSGRLQLHTTHKSQAMATAQVPTTEEWIKNMWYMYTMAFYSAIGRMTCGLKVNGCNRKTPC
jgi:spore germination protein YaaH